VSGWTRSCTRGAGGSRPQLALVPLMREASNESKFHGGGLIDVSGFSTPQFSRVNAGIEGFIDYELLEGNGGLGRQQKKSIRCWVGDNGAGPISLGAFIPFSGSGLRYFDKCTRSFTVGKVAQILDVNPPRASLSGSRCGLFMLVHTTTWRIDNDVVSTRATQAINVSVIFLLDLVTSHVQQRRKLDFGDAP